MYLIRQRPSKYIQNSYVSNLTIYTNLIYKIWVGVGKGIVIDYFELEFERIGRLNKVTLGIIELMMNPGDEVHMEELSTEERIIELSVIIWRLTKQRHCNQPISNAEFEPHWAIKQSHNGHHRTHDEPRRWRITDSYAKYKLSQYHNNRISQ